MKRYENWRELKPLTAPVPVGTKCVVVADGGVLKQGDVVFIAHSGAIPCTK